MNTNEQNARINQLLKRYDEAKTTDAEEAELAEFFRTATEVSEEWQDYAVLFSVLDSVDTLFINEEVAHRPSKSSLKEDFISSPFKGDRSGSGNSKGWWWAISIAAAIIVVVGLAEELLAEETSGSEQTNDSLSQPDRAGGLPTGSTTKGFGGATYIRGLTMTHADSMLIGRVAGCDSLIIPEKEVPEYAMIHSSADYCLAGDPTSDAWRDSVLVMVDGEVNEELHRAVRADGWFDIDLAEYFKEKGRLINGESLWWENMKATKHSIKEYVRKNGEKALTEEMRKALDSPYQYVANIETVAYPKQTANKKLQEDFDVATTEMILCSADIPHHKAKEMLNRINDLGYMKPTKWTECTPETAKEAYERIYK